MKLFGLNISRSSSASVTKSASESDPAAWLRGEETNTNTTVLSNAYQQVVWVYRAINVLAEQVANIPFLFSAGERGRENLITSGPLLDFYDRPHPHMNRFQYWELRVIWLMLRGECFRIPIYEDAHGTSPSPGGEGRGEGGLHYSSQSARHEDGPPISQIKHRKRKLKNVLLLDPSHFHHIIDNHQLVGWRYTGFGRNTPLESQIFLPEEVWFEKLPNPFDFWRGMPPLYVAEVAAKTDYAAGAFMKGLIENNADLGVVVRTQTPLDPTQREQILAALRNRKNKAGTADRPLLLWSGAEIVKPQLSSADMQFLDHRKFSRAEICAAFGVPEEIITTTDKAKYDVMQGARLNFIENRVAPLCARLEAEEEATVRSIDRNAVGWFDTDALPIMQEARRSRLAAVKTGFDMGIPFNELNRIFDLGFKPLPWGNTGYLKSNLNPLGTLPPKN